MWYSVVCEIYKQKPLSKIYFHAMYKGQFVRIIEHIIILKTTCFQSAN